MLELQITSPTAEQHFPTIKWNHAELKRDIAEYVKDYENLVVTQETEKDCKEVRANLNKLRTAIETARKDMKKKVNEPLKLFEEQVRSVEEPINTAIERLDVQLKELADGRKEQKKADIKTMWLGMYGVPNYLTLDRIWNDKWLNATYSMKQITADMTEILQNNRKAVDAILKLPEYSYEAMEYYMDTLDITKALEKASEHAEIQKRKEKAQKEQDESFISPEVPQNEVANKPEMEDTEVKLYTFTFNVTLTAEQAKQLGDFCRENGIKLRQIK